MKKRMLRDIEVSEVGMGCMAFSHGYGQIPPEKYSIEAIQNAYDHGCTFFDTAEIYSPNLAGIGHNELIVGKALKDVRENVVIATKLMLHGFSFGSVYKTIRNHLEGSIDRLQTDYVDLWLMHWPYPDYYIDTWHKMEKVYKSGKVRAIGMANYRIRHFEHLFNEGVEIMPHCVQFELHPMRTAEDIVAYCRERNIAIQAYSPLCRMIKKIRESKELQEIAARHQKSVAQVILRWHIQNHTVPVFKSLKRHRLKENFDIFDFQLSESEMAQVASLDEDYKYHLESASCPGY